MKAILSCLIMLLSCTLVGCDGSQPFIARTVAPAPNAGLIDPAIPTVTVTARRLSTAEKLAYDQAAEVRLASLKQDQ